MCVRVFWLALIDCWIYCSARMHTPTHMIRHLSIFRIIPWFAQFFDWIHLFEDSHTKLLIIQQLFLPHSVCFTLSKRVLDKRKACLCELKLFVWIVATSRQMKMSIFTVDSVYLFRMNGCYSFCRIDKSNLFSSRFMKNVVFSFSCTRS